MRFGKKNNIYIDIFCLVVSNNDCSSSLLFLVRLIPSNHEAAVGGSSRLLTC